MKKLISIVMALMIAMFAVSAVAEAPETAYTGEIGINISAEGVSTLMAAGGASMDGQENMVNSIVSIINNVSLKGVVAGKEAQADLLLKGESLATFAAKKEKGGVLSIFSDIIPNSYITVADETLKALMQQVSQSMEGIDVQAVATAVMPHLQSAGETVMSKVGEAEAVSYTFNGTEFTSKIPVNMTTKEIAVLGLTMVKDIASEEAVAPLLAQSEGFSVEEIEKAIQEIQEKSDDELPVTDIALYSNEGGDVLFDTSMSKDGEAFVMQFAVTSEKIIAHIDALSQATIDMDIDLNTGSLKLNASFDANGMKAGLDLTLQIGQDITGELAVSLNGTNLITLSGKLEKGGTITASFDTAGKTETKLEDLMSGNSSAAEALTSDVQNNIMGLVMKAMQIMPDEIGALMGGSN